MWHNKCYNKGSGSCYWVNQIPKQDLGEKEQLWSKMKKLVRQRGRGGEREQRI